jgi:hypothetical protein
MSSPERYERTALGDQGVMAGTPGRQMPTGKIRPRRPQKDVSETPLFSGTNPPDDRQLALGGQEGQGNDDA